MLLLIPLLAGLVQVALAQEFAATFTYPAEKGLRFYEQDTVNVSYTSNIKNASLWTFCWEGDEPKTLETKKVIDDVAPLNGSELIYIDFKTNSDSCWFNLRDRNSKEPTGGNSIMFALSANMRSQTTLGLAGPSATASPSTSSETPKTTDVDGSAQGTHAPSLGNGGLTVPQKAGIGVGVAVAVVIIAALMGCFIIKKKRSHGKSGTADGLSGVAEVKRQELEAQTPLHELSGDEPFRR